MPNNQYVTRLLRRKEGCMSNIVNRRRVMGKKEDIIIINQGLRNVGGILNTGVTQATNLEIILDGKFNEILPRGSGCIIAQNNWYATHGAVYLSYSNSRANFFVIQNQVYNETTTPKDINRHIFHIHNGSIDIDNETVGTCNAIEFNTSNQYAVKLMSSTDRTTRFAYNCTLYSCKLYDEGVPIRDYYPAFSKTNNAYCLYDEVNNSILLPEDGYLEVDE